MKPDYTGFDLPRRVILSVFFKFSVKIARWMVGRCTPDSQRDFNGCHLEDAKSEAPMLKTLHRHIYLRHRFAEAI